jgi:hypothetical protein
MFKKHVSHWLPVSVLFLLVIVIALLNYESGTFLSGWDNIHHEFNLGLSWRRVLSGAWLSGWGLGVGSGMAYAADLPRLIVYTFLSVFLPVSVIRYVWVFSMLLLGVLGSYSLFYLVFRNKMSGFFGAMFYLFNLATVQYFFTPFVSFIAFYGFLPWLLFGFMRYIRNRKRSDLQFLGVISFFSGPAFFVQTLFLVASIVLATATLGYFFQKKSSRRSVFFAWMVFLGAQLYWLLPTLYYSLNHASVVVQSKINALTTLETQLSNQAYSNIVDIALLRGFWFSYTDAQIELETGLLMTPWVEHVDGLVIVAGLILFGVVVMGYIYLVTKSKNVEKWVPILLFMVGYLMLAQGEWLASQIPFFGQVFRSAFTKWSMVMALAYAWGIAAFSDVLSRNRKLFFPILSALTLLMVYSCFPMFKGSLVYESLRVNIPSEYEELFSYLQTQDKNQRVVHVPASWHWGWTYYSWGYRGSGFLWYGIEQPVMDRAFDVWSQYNETFYNELSTVFYFCPSEPSDVDLRKCAANVRQVLDKYQVSLVLLDESVIVPGQDQDFMRYDLWKSILSEIDKEADFESGLLSVYSVGQSLTGISAPKQYRQIEADLVYGRFDPFYSSETTYVSGNDAVYPFSSISRENVSGMLQYGLDGSVKIMGNTGSGKMLELPEFSPGDVWQGRIRATLVESELTVEILPFGQIVIGDQRFPLWLDQRLKVIQVPEVLESVVVQVGNKVKTIGRDKPDEIWDIPMTVGQGLSLNVFEGEGEEITISTPSARLGSLPAGRLIEVSGDDRICLGYEQEHYQCLNQEHNLVTPQEGVYWLDVLGKAEKLPEVTIYEPVVRYEFSDQMWEMVKRSFEIEAFDLPISWETSMAPFWIERWTADENAKNCDVLQRGTAGKKIADGAVRYEATGYGAHCDSWGLKSIMNEGVLRLQGENVSGRGIKLSVFSNQENRTLLEQLLPSGGKFDRSYGFLTGLQMGSTINVETKSFGRIEGKNQLDAVWYYPIPLTWLQKIKLSSGAHNVLDGNLIILDEKNLGSSVHISDVSGEGVVVLNQGFDDGWVAISEGKVLEHLKVNGWANGWKVVNSGKVYLFYWPQLLEWVGMGILLVGGVGLLLYSRNRSVAD